LEEDSLTALIDSVMVPIWFTCNRNRKGGREWWGKERKKGMGGSAREGGGEDRFGV
jgi:hypothetical protein